MQPFSAKDTTDGDFTLADGKKVKVPLMSGHNRTNYFNGDGFQALELPYEAARPVDDRPAAEEGRRPAGWRRRSPRPT